jgi:hypothetical protein
MSAYPTWKCLTCHRTGTGDVPARCPTCNSESDDRHGPIALTIKVTDQCTLRLAVNVTAESREAILRRMARIRPSKPHRDRPVDYVKALELAEERGEVAPAERQIDPGATPDDKARCIVRIYYRSIGGEILACDSAPLSMSAANALERDMDDVTSWALGTERYRAGDVGPLRSGVRLVTLPSQVRDPVVVVDPGAPEVCEAPPPMPEAPPAPILPLCEAPHVPPAPRQIFNTYYHEAMVKRTARFQAMHRRSIAA